MPEQLTLSLEIATPDLPVAGSTEAAGPVRPEGARRERRSGTAQGSGAGRRARDDDWRIDERTREVGRRGLAEARRALARSGQHATAA